MPSPFPGMDPYLEDPGLWSDVHHGLISETQAQLNKLLRPKYHVRVEERVYVSDEYDPGRRFIIPDLRVAEVAGWEGFDLPTGATLVDEEMHEAYLEVIDTSLRQVVTVIEILSPTNKCPGSKGREPYFRKRQEVMQSPSHLIEIDLLREGESIVTREMLPPHEYRVHLSRAQNRPQGMVWPIRLRQRLPVIDIPLHHEDPDAALDLQTVLTTAYDRAAYDLEIDYRKDTSPPLRPELANWAEKIIKGSG